MLCFGKKRKDLALQREVVAMGSVNKVIEEKQYNRAARMHKIIYACSKKIHRLDGSGATIDCKRSKSSA